MILTSRNLLIVLMISFVCLGSNAQTDKGSLALFPDSIKIGSAGVVYTFLERYLYQASKSSRGYDFYQNMADDKVILREGSFDNIPKLKSNVQFSIERFEDKGYGVEWKDTLNRTLLSLLFPIKYELLLGKTKAEIEQTMSMQLKACADTFDVVKPDTAIKAIEGGVFCSASVSHYYVKSVNTSRYYVLADGVAEPLYSSKWKAYSAANLFHGLINDISDYQFYIHQNLYDYKEQNYTIKLAQWLNYCRDNNLVVYFGIEEEREDGIKALLIALNQDLNYNHMLSIIIPDTFVKKKNTILKATLNAYIPTDNIKNLYQEYTKKKKKKL